MINAPTYAVQASLGVAPITVLVGTGTLCISILDLTSTGKSAYVVFGATNTVTASVNDFALPPNSVTRFEVGPSSKYISIVTTAAANLTATWFVEGRNG